MKDNSTTIDFYNRNAENFIQGTIDVDFTDVQEKFLKYMPNGSRILDFGCGSGRDSKYFLSKGFAVDAVDGSEELCNFASRITGISVRRMLFSELDEVASYDGIWACSSILHLPKDELKDVFFKMTRAVKNEGYIYVSFKYGNFEGYRNDRYYTDFTEELFYEFLKEIPGVKVKELWISEDVRPDRSDEKWLNLILQKLVTA